MALSTDLFDYTLPPELIAQAPAERRDASRLLVVDRATRTVVHRQFSDLPDYLRAGDILVRNNAAVLPARLRAQRPSGGAVECLLLRPDVDRTDAERGREDVWWCLLRPGKKLPPGDTFSRPAIFTGTVLDKNPDGHARVRFSTPDGAPINDVARILGEMPLPPYIERPAKGVTTAAEAEQRTRDVERYQTVYAEKNRQVAVAAPTAGLHFTPELLARVATQGVLTADVTLHVGLGTFKPIMTDTVEAHAIHRERYEMSPETQAHLFRPSGRRIAVGTTSVRSVEDFLSRHSAPTAGAFVTDTEIYIHPPATFRGVDALITNFHQPRSTLLCLVSAFLAPGSTDGIAWLREIYAEAIARRYRFFSYGDAMLVL